MMIEPTAKEIVLMEAAAGVILEDFKKLEVENAKLRKYVNHTISCTFSRFEFDYYDVDKDRYYYEGKWVRTTSCDCGLDTVLKGSVTK